jgi:hypothetical protein
MPESQRIVWPVVDLNASELKMMVRALLDLSGKEPGNEEVATALKKVRKAQNPAERPDDPMPYGQARFYLGVILPLLDANASGQITWSECSQRMGGSARALAKLSFDPDA